MSRVTSHPFTTLTEDSFSDVYSESLHGEVFITDDLILAGFLLALDYEADAVVWNDGRCHWTFVRDGVLADDVSAYMTGEAFVEPKRFHHSTNTCRAAMGDSKPRY